MSTVMPRHHVATDERARCIVQSPESANCLSRGRQNRWRPGLQQIGSIFRCLDINPDQCHDKGDNHQSEAWVLELHLVSGRI